jgi:exonuclease SbcC
MLITRIELENIKSYRHASIDFRRGTTAISGTNGAGKTTLVEAIGFALFDYLPYSQAHFVREGEKHGRVVVHLVGSDDRPYVVERRCGSGSRWFIYDQEADYNCADQRVDVLDKLHDLFGIDRERSLDALFKDALGVPQGTFTAIFLEAASKRKQTFDTLLQIEDYKLAFDYLLDVQKHYKEQMRTQQDNINQLTYETRDLESWRLALKEKRLLDEQQKEQNAHWSQCLVQYEERNALLMEQSRQVEQLRQRYEQCQKDCENARQLLHEREQFLQAARVAQQIVVNSSADFQQHQQANETLKRLRQDEQQRNGLRQRQNMLQHAAATSQANINNWQERLSEVATARQLLAQLTPLLAQQAHFEQQCDTLKQKARRYEDLGSEAERLKQKISQYRQQQEGLQQRITAIEPLQAVAALFTERNETLTQLRIKGSERSSKFKQLQEKRTQLREKQLERDQVAEKFRKADNNVAIIEEHRREAEQMPHLQEQYEQLSAQCHRLEGNIEAYTNSRAQSAGGQCPLLQETCLNIKKRGLVSLEFYFDGLLQEEHTQLVTVQQQQSALTEQMGKIKKYFDALNKLGQYINERDTRAEQLQRIALDITRLERDSANLAQDMEALKQVEQQISGAEIAYNESKQADNQVRELTGLYKQLQQLQEQIHQCETDLRERQQEAENLKDSGEQLEQVNAELERLNDPRYHSRTQQDIIAHEKDFEQQLQTEQQQWQETQQRLQTLQEQIKVYDSLDADIAAQEALAQHSQAGYLNYLTNEKEAHLLPERERTYQQQSYVTEQAMQKRQEVEQAYLSAQAAFNEEELKTITAEIKRLRDELAALAAKMQRLQKDINDQVQQIEKAEALYVELEAAQKEHQELADLHAMMEHFRKLIKEAAPYVLKAMLNDISAEANRIFGEIMGDRSAQLSWQNDYEIVLRRQSINRTFAQLSGGEQMSAALAVRLALLKKLSTLNLAFFDEPTQNMDELRRMNLAEQIRRVRGFDQLIVISHDDTFEQGLDSIVRLQKVDGDTRVQGVDGAVDAWRPQGITATIHAGAGERV